MSDNNLPEDMPQALKDLIKGLQADKTVESIKVVEVKGHNKPKSEETITEAVTRKQVLEIVKEYTKLVMDNARQIAEDDTPFEEWKAKGLGLRAAEMTLSNANACTNRIMLALKEVK